MLSLYIYIYMFLLLFLVILVFELRALHQVHSNVNYTNIDNEFQRESRKGVNCPTQDENEKQGQD